MGGDHAPHGILEGLCSFSKKNPDVFFKVYGQRHLIEAPLRSVKNCEIIHCDELVENTTTAKDALRLLKGSSMRQAILAVREGKCDACVSAGNTGAYMALSKVLLKTLPGIDRPAITGSLPSSKGPIVMVDLGANISVTPLNLLQFAIMGQAFARAALKKEKPTVGLLNIGSEELKGSDLLKETQDIFKNHPAVPHYRGFIEGSDIFTGTTDVVVTDGFSGNISLKSAEGVVKFFSSEMRRLFTQSLWSKFVYLLSFKIFQTFKATMDPRLHNGAPFLGLRGIAVKSHGSADAFAFASALGVAHNLARHRINDVISQEISALQDAFDGFQRKA